MKSFTLFPSHSHDFLSSLSFPLPLLALTSNRPTGAFLPSHGLAEHASAGTGEANVEREENGAGESKRKGRKLIK